MAEPRRILRLARAQEDMAELLERRISAQRQTAAELASTKSGTLAALERASTAGLAFYAAALRRIAVIDEAIATSDEALRNLTARLLQARRRQEGLMRRAQQLQAVLDRREAEEGAREVALAMRDKATDKPRMLE